MRCIICYHLCNLKNVKNAHREVLLLVKLHATVLKVTVPFLNYTNGTKLCNASNFIHIVYSETLLGPCQTSIMALIVKIVNGYKCHHRL